MTCTGYQLIGYYIMRTLTFNGLDIAPFLSTLICILYEEKKFSQHDFSVSYKRYECPEEAFMIIFMTLENDEKKL